MPNPIRVRRLGSVESYARRVLRTRPGNFVGYWPMSETAGTVAFDLSPQGNNGAYTGVDLAQPGIGDGRVCPWFDGTNDFNNIYSAALNTDFNAAAGTMAAWARVNAASVWTDSGYRVVVQLRTDDSNQIYLLKQNTNNTIRALYRANNVTQSVDTTLSLTGWFHLALTWDTAADEVKAYLNGVQSGTTQTGLDTWAGALDSTLCHVGAYSTVPASIWHGWLAHVAIWNAALSAGEMAYLLRVR